MRLHTRHSNKKYEAKTVPMVVISPSPGLGRGRGGAVIFFLFLLTLKKTFLTFALAKVVRL